jgi:hypothetical protein
MTKIAQEAAELVNSLPPEKAQALIEYARYLAEKADEEEWERKFSDPKYAPKLKSMMAEADEEIAAGRVLPLDFKKP